MSVATPPHRPIAGAVRHARTALALLSAAALAAGCSPAPPEPAETADAELSVEMPAGGSDSGSLSDVAIEPPPLNELDRSQTPAREASHASSAADSAADRDRSEVAADEDASSAEPRVSSAAEPAAASVAEAASPAGSATPGEDPHQYREWPVPDVALVFTGQQHGYIEPCGCTGLENQKGGVARRFTFLQQLRERGWQLLPIDAGNQIRRFGRQGEIKYHRTLEALRKMDYQAVGFGPDDLRLSVGDLIQEAAAETPGESLYASGNVVLLDPSLMPAFKVLSKGGWKIGVTSILDPAASGGAVSEEIAVQPPVESAQAAMEQLAAESPDFRVLTFFGDEKAAKELVRAVPGFDLVVVAGGYGEPTYQPQPIENSTTKMIVTGSKGMYAGLIGLYEGRPMRYARVALTDEFEDAPEMRQLMADYQAQLRDLGLEGLGLKPIPHPSGNEFVGTATCGECHGIAHDIWQESPHARATEDIVHPGERSDVPRHFDPECLSCHVTGWNPQNYYPYTSGYLSLEQSSHLTGSGCENCHGPGSAHVAAERGESAVTEQQRKELRLEMRLPLDEARQRCLECHDLDNSPDFHEEGAFWDYWDQVEHYGLE